MMFVRVSDIVAQVVFGVNMIGSDMFIVGGKDVQRREIIAIQGDKRGEAKLCQLFLRLKDIRGRITQAVHVCADPLIGQGCHIAAEAMGDESYSAEIALDVRNGAFLAIGCLDQRAQVLVQESTDEFGVVKFWRT